MGAFPTPVDPMSVAGNNPQAMGPAGTVHASLADLEVYVRCYLQGGIADSGHHLKGWRNSRQSCTLVFRAESARMDQETRHQHQAAVAEADTRSSHDRADYIFPGARKAGYTHTPLGLEGCRP